MLQLNYKVFGEGPPLIILHGLLGSLDNWQSLARRFGEHFTTYIVDQRNHGRSPHTESYTTAEMSQDLDDFIQQQGIEKTYLIGHSMGGKTVMQFALDHPEKVAKQVVADIAPKAYAGGHEPVFEALESLDIEHITSRQQADELLSIKIPDFGMRQFLLKNIDRTKEGYRWKPNLDTLWNDYPEILKPLKVRQPREIDTLVIRGGNSDYVLDADLHEFRRLFGPHVQMETISGAGHWVHAEAPDRFFSLALEFLQR